MAISLIVSLLAPPICAETVEVNDTNFPDPNFRDYIKTTINDNGVHVFANPYNESDNTLTINEVNTLWLGPGNLTADKKISSLVGTELFYAFQNIDCDGNHLAAIKFHENANIANLSKDGKYEGKCDLGSQTIDIGTKEAINLTTYDRNFDVTKVHDLTGATLSNDGTLTFAEGSAVATYNYIPVLARYQSNGDCIMRVTITRDILIPVTADNFPDENFRKYITEKLNNDNSGKNPYDAASNTVNQSAVENINCENYKIKNLYGVELFEKLGRLRCGNNQIVAVNLPKDAWDVSLGKQTVVATAADGMTIDLKAYDKNFDPAIVTRDEEHVIGGTLSDDGKFTFDKGEFEGSISYEYTLGNGQKKPITIELHRYADKVKLTADNFPDEAFRNYLKGLDGGKYYDEATNEISLGIGKMDIDYWGGRDITSLKGIEKFVHLHTLNINDRKVGASLAQVELPTSLVFLYCSNAEGLVTIKNLSDLTNLERLNIANNALLESLDVSNNVKLTHLSCGSDGGAGHTTILKNLKLPASIEDLDCSRVLMTSLDLTACTGLKFLKMNFARSMSTLTLPSDRSKLQTVTVDNCILKTIDVTGCTSLRRLEISNNLLEEIKGLHDCAALDTLVIGNPLAYPDSKFNDFKRAKLDLDGNKGLKWLDCMHMNISELDLSKHTELEFISCGLNSPVDESHPEFKLTLPESAPKLRTVNCGNNKLTNDKLEPIKGYEALEILECANNELTALDVSQNKNLWYIYARENRLEAIDVSNNSKLRHLTCSYNPINTLDVTKNPLLTSLNCNDNGLKTLDLSNNLELDTLHVENNHLIALDLTGQTKLFDVKVDNQSLNLGTGRHFNMERRNGSYDGENVQDVTNAMFSKNFTDYVIDTTEDDENFDATNTPDPANLDEPATQAETGDGTEPGADPGTNTDNTGLTNWLTFDEQEVEATYNYRTGGVFNDAPTEGQKASAPRRVINRSEPETYTGDDGKKYALMDVKVTRDGVTTGIATVEAGRDAARVSTEPGAAIVYGAEGRISVYTTAGTLAATATATAGYPTRIPLAPGFYMVVTSTTTAKILVP